MEVPIATMRKQAVRRSPKAAKPAATANLGPQARFSEARLLAENALDSLKGMDIVYIDLAGKATFADGMLVATATSGRHAASLADAVDVALEKGGFPVSSIQGKNGGEWVLLDAGDLVVHVFQDEFRRLYNLEKLWSI